MSKEMKLILDASELKIDGYSVLEILEAIDFAKRYGWRQEPPKPPMRVWTNNHSELLVTSEIPTDWNDGLVWMDISEPLAKALAQFIKKELNL
jgi:hypothetical protein